MTKKVEPGVDLDPDLFLTFTKKVQLFLLPQEMYLHILEVSVVEPVQLWPGSSSGYRLRLPAPDNNIFVTQI